MKKVLSIALTLCLFANISFAFDPYADEEVEKKSYKKLYYGIVLTLLGGFLAYDGFSQEEVDVSKPRVDYTTVFHSEYAQRARPEGESDPNPIYEMRSGISLNNALDPDDEENVPSISDDPSNITTFTYYEIEGDKLYKQIESNRLYNSGNVDLKNITIEVRYKYRDGTYIGSNGEHVTREGYYINGEGERVYVENQGYHIAQTNESDSTETEHVETKIYGGEGNYITLKKGESINWQDIWGYTAEITDSPVGDPRQPYTDKTVGKQHFHKDGTQGLNLGKNALKLIEVRIKLNKNQQYKPIYEKRNKCDAEGVAGILVGLTGIYFIIDHFLDMHKFNAYAKRHHLNLKVTTASNEYKLMLQKRI